MSYKSIFKEALLSLDTVGNKITLKHKKFPRIRTLLGSFLTSGVVIFFLYCVVYFGADMVYKSNPISMYYKHFNDTSKIYLKDFPLMIVFHDSNLSTYPITELSKYISINSLRAVSGVEGDEDSSLQIAGCTNETLGNHFGAFLNTSQVYSDNGICFNPCKLVYQNGTIADKEVFIQNEFASQNSAILKISFNGCVNKTDNNNACASVVDQKSFINNLYITIYYIDSYINLKSYDQSINHYLSQQTYLLSTELGKSSFITVKNTYINTDSGFVLEQNSDDSVYQIEKIRTDVFTKGDIFVLYLESQKITDNYYRKYTKVQDIIANIGGVLKLLLSISSIILSFYSKFDLTTDIINTVYQIPDPNEKDNLNNKQLRDISTSQIVNNNYMQESIQTQPKLKNLKTSFFDYLKAKLRCKSRYSKVFYKMIYDAVNDQFELTNIIKKFLVIDKMVEFLADDQKEKISNKFVFHAVKKDLKRNSRSLTVLDISGGG
jgi:hypothetical protein